MESSIILRIKTDSSEKADLIELCLGPDAPVFADDFPDPDRPVFDALENLFPPEDITRTDSCSLEMHWITGGELEEDINGYCKAFLKAGAHHIVGYYWADEDEGFFVCKDRKLRNIRGWEKQLEALGIHREEVDEEDDVDEDADTDWVSVFLGHLQRTEFK